VPTKEAVQHTVAAPARLVFDLVAKVQDWPRFHARSVHAEPLGTNRFQYWSVIDDNTAGTWVASWHVDRTNLRIESESGTWDFHPVSDSVTEVRVTGAEFADLLPAVVDEAEQFVARQDVVVDFEDTLFVSGSVDDAYAYLYEADKWPERIPHVSRLVLTETVPNIQFFDMDTRTPDGSAHTTRSVRICLPGNKIVYKQIQLPKLLSCHTGHWRFTETREGFIMGARHTAVIKPDALSVLGPDTTVLDARKYLRRVLSANSMGNLRLAKAYAEERAGV
jgi:C7-C12 aromatase (ARO/CYC)